MRFGAGHLRRRYPLRVVRARRDPEFLNEKPGNAAADSDETCFDRFDYLSTVSGGGYIGGAVTWLKHHFGKDGELAVVSG